ncbi:MAG: hypothetical protein JNL51_12600 [Chitinophagaceae bacterium]|nr:hypothetical protein [Chitinophagaceae bacterium]
MKNKLVSISLLFTFFLFAGLSEASAQSKGKGSSYQNAIGLGIDFGDGLTLAGFSGKHFFSEHNVGKAELLFGDHYTFIQAFYEYHDQFEGAAGLRWFVGVGPGVALAKRSSSFLIRPTAGIDYKINNVPLNFTFDWRPWLAFNDGSEFEGARFGLGFRYAF